MKSTPAAIIQRTDNICTDRSNKTQDGGIAGNSVQFQLSHSFDVRDSRSGVGTVGDLRSRVSSVGDSESTGSRVDDSGVGDSESTGSRVKILHVDGKCCRSIQSMNFQHYVTVQLAFKILCHIIDQSILMR